jgi:hypothetical protein
MNPKEDHMTRTTLLAAVFGLMALPAFAQDTTAIDTMDADADGMVSFVELQAAMPDMTEETLMTMDVNGDGMLDADEVAAATEAETLPAAN